MANQNLSAAKSAKNDEFYTQYADIQKEVNAYLEYDPDVFRGKSILLPCDGMEQGRGNHRRQLSDALQDAQPRKGKSVAEKTN